LGRTRILFTSSLDTPFINEDFRLLSIHCDVERLTTRGLRAPFHILPRVLTADLTYTWFASTYAFWVVSIASLLGKPSIVVVGGVDAAKIPEIGYGIWLSWWKSRLVRRAVMKASKVLVVADALRVNLTRLAGYEGKNIQWVPTGYDGLFWKPAGEKEGIVLTVAACDDVPRLRVKGIDFLFRCAAAMPDVRFVVVGVQERVLRQAGLPDLANVRVLPFANREEVLRLYQVARVYCLPSLVEGMPNSLCEAMLCGCVPVAVDVGGVSDVIGNLGFLIHSGDQDAMVGALRKALNSPAAESERSRSRILEFFPLARREQEIMQAVAGVLP
jgi:glycosyltransferase involved in cell wall biosynthesis